jgi:hypothetical protein
MGIRTDAVRDRCRTNGLRMRVLLGSDVRCRAVYSVHWARNATIEPMSARYVRPGGRYGGHATARAANPAGAGRRHALLPSASVMPPLAASTSSLPTTPPPPPAPPPHVRRRILSQKRSMRSWMRLSRGLHLLGTSRTCQRRL